MKRVISTLMLVTLLASFSSSAFGETYYVLLKTMMSGSALGEPTFVSTDFAEDGGLVLAFDLGKNLIALMGYNASGKYEGSDWSTNSSYVIANMYYFSKNFSTFPGLTIMYRYKEEDNFSFVSNQSEAKSLADTMKAAFHFE